MTVRTERMRLRIWDLTPGSSPKPPTPWSTPQPTGDGERGIEREEGEVEIERTEIYNRDSRRRQQFVREKKTRQ